MTDDAPPEAPAQTPEAVSAPEPTPAPAPPVVAPASTPEMTSTSLSSDDDELVAALKLQLASFSKALSRPGSKPEDYRAAAKLALQITKFVIQTPKVSVLDALLAFFEENINGVCSQQMFMKGSTTLSGSDEQQVGFLYNLFAQMAMKQQVRINNQQVVAILKKPEIANYYQRRMAVFAQTQRNAA